MDSGVDAELQKVKPSEEIFKEFPHLEVDKQITLIQDCIENKPPHSGLRPFQAELTDLILESPNKQRLIGGVLDYIYNHRDEYNYRGADWSGYHSIQLTEVDDWADYITFRDPEACLLAISSIDDWGKALTLTGIMVDRDSLSWVTERVARQLVGLEDEPDQRKRLERLGKVLIGLDPDDERTFYTALNDLYAGLAFDEYESNIHAQQKDLEVVEAVIEKGQSAVVVDMGCGTGRISNSISEKYSELQVVGIDPSEECLTTAKKEDKSKKVRYIEGTIEDNPLDEDSVDTIIVLGRTLTHLRGHHQVKEAFGRFNKALKKGGKVIFDAPNPNSGVYLENRKRYLDILRSLKIPLPEDDAEALKHFYWVVDSPDKGKSLYDRYVPDWHGPALTQTGVIDNRLTYKDVIGNSEGFKIQEIDHSPIFGWEGAENIYFEAVKKE